MKWRRWAEFSVKSTLLFSVSALQCRSSSSSRLCGVQLVSENRCYSHTAEMAEEAKKLAAYAAVDNHIQVRAREGGTERRRRRKRERETGRGRKAERERECVHSLAF